MIMGQCICLRCGKTFPANESCFYSPVHKITYAIVPGFGKKPKVYKNHEEISSKMVEKPSYLMRNGIVRRVSVDIREGNRRVQLSSDYTRRYCPRCYKRGVDSEIQYEMGYNDCMLIALMGRTSVGKTSYYDCLVSPTGGNHLQSMLHVMGYKVSYYQKGDYHEAHATETDEFHPLQGITIQKDQRGAREFTLFLVDIAGEDFLVDSSGNTDFQIRYERFLSKCDAFLVFHDKANLYQTGVQTAAQERGNSITNFLRQYTDRTVLYIYTKADQLKSQCPLMGVNREYGLYANSSLLRPLRPENMRSSDQLESELACHMGLAGRFFSRCVTKGYASVRPGAPCFVVSSGNTIKDGRLLYINHGEEMNTALPILYLAYQFL